MFTGIVEQLGTVAEYKTLDESQSGGNGVSLLIKNATEILGDCNLGDSISVNGVCLTVTEFTRDEFKVGIAPETLRRSNLGELKEGDKVNLERAVAGHTRFGGHFVQGHVDTVATIVSLTPDENSLAVTLRPRDSRFLRYIIEKGFIALDGTSLTITNVDDENETFSIMLIAYTQEKVILASKKVGDPVNVEVDMMGKLIERQVNSLLDREVGEGGTLRILVEKVVERVLVDKGVAK
jgi:riboflavin synthase